MEPVRPLFSWADRYAVLVYHALCTLTKTSTVTRIFQRILPCDQRDLREQLIPKSLAEVAEYAEEVAEVWNLNA